MKIVDLEIHDISLSGSASGAYAMVLVERGGVRKIPMIIGETEAQAIAIELENMKPSRPLTHDLIKNTLIAFDLTVTEVLIYNFDEGVFFARITVTDGVRTEEIDSRSSDAIAVAVRFRVPIRCYESVIEVAGIEPEEEEGDQGEDEFPSSVEIVFESDMDELEDVTEELDLPTLEIKLNEAINNEDYESASKIRDEIEKIKKKK